MTNRYISSYSRNKFKVRDRLTGQETTINMSEDVAEVYTDAIKQTNYNLRETKHGKVQIRSLNDLQLWLNSTTKEDKRRWGDIPPSEINWEKPKPKVLNNDDNKLNKILGLKQYE